MDKMINIRTISENIQFFLLREELVHCRLLESKNPTQPELSRDFIFRFTSAELASSTDRQYPTTSWQHFT